MLQVKSLKMRGWETVALITLLFFQPAISFAQTANEIEKKKYKDTSLVFKLNELMTAYAETGLFSGSVFIQQRNKELLNRGYGFSDIASQKLHSADSKFAIYSITKSFTAAVIMRLVQDGKLNLNYKLSRFYPGFAAADSITIEHLLTHTSGLYNYNNDYSMPVENEDSIIAFLAKRKLAFSPGSQWSYCNTGYYLLGFIIQKTTGITFEDAIRRYIFGPLKMYNSGFDYRSLNDPDKSTGYTVLFSDTGQVAMPYQYAELFSAGGIWSTTHDLYKFHKGMQQNKIINKLLTAKAYEIFKGNYGFGWFIDSVAGKRVVSHSGGAAGFRSFLVRIVEDNTCIVLLSNAENSDLTPLKNKLLNIILDRPYDLPTAVKVEKQKMTGLEGTYILEPGRYLYVSQIGKHLTAKVSGQSPATLLPKGENTFGVDGMDGFLKFKRNSGNIYDTVMLFRKKRKFTGVRVQSSWGIAGTALEGGWYATDILLVPVNQSKSVWIRRNVKLKNGEIKFLYNNDWTFNYGSGPGDGYLFPDGKNIAVIAGNYDIILYQDDKGYPCYRLKRLQL
jgi:CubicO group peptidase (beta-lactamase class C family)